MTGTGASREGPVAQAERPLFPAEATFADTSSSDGLAPEAVIPAVILPDSFGANFIGRLCGEPADQAVQRDDKSGFRAAFPG
jgi:hypothetical protein